MKPTRNTQKEVIKAVIFSILNGSPKMTPEIKQKLKAFGFRLEIIVCKEEDRIESLEVKENFNGYDFAIGVASTCASYASGRRFSAYVYNVQSDERPSSNH